MNTYQPLAALLRPKTIDAFVGQKHLLDSGKPLRQVIDQNQVHSMIFWGPPGVGKTTLAQIIARKADAEFIPISAVLSGVKDIRQAISQAQTNQNLGQKTILFVDEIHRFNKSQQDAFLPHVESGLIILMGATTENPSFELNNALLSRARVYVLKPLSTQDMQDLLERALSHLSATADEHAKTVITTSADGDARRLLGSIEISMQLAQAQNTTHIDTEIIEQTLAQSYRRFDKQGESFYDQISALHKSVRGSDADASLYWFCRMLDGGCDPLYIARRVVRMASEDIGNADPKALQICLNAWETQERLGSPEGELAVAQAIVYLAAAPKSNAVYAAYKQAMKFVKEFPSNEVPLHLRNAPTQLMKEQGYGKEYRYAHDYPGAYVPNENYFPDDVLSRTGVKPAFYDPVERGLEIKIKEKLERLKQLDNKSR